MDAKAEKLALLRYGLIAPLVLEPLARGELTRRAEEIASGHYDIPDSKRRAVSVDTLLDWAARYRNCGFEALAPKPRLAGVRMPANKTSARASGRNAPAVMRGRALPQLSFCGAGVLTCRTGDHSDGLAA